MKKFFLPMLLLLGVMTAYAAEGDTHVFTQSISAVVNGGATIDAITIPAQTYSVKEVRVSYNYNKTNSKGVTVSVAVGTSNWGSKTAKDKLETNVYQNFVYTGTATTDSVVVSFVNNNTEASGCGTFKVNKITLVEGPGSSVPVVPSDTTVSPTTPVVPAVNRTYNILQNINDLHDGDSVFLAPHRAATDYVLGLYDYDVASANIRGAAAQFDANRHQVTASSAYAYRVKIADGKYQFIGSDGKYLYMYNTNKNLSSTDTDSTSNKAKWTISVADDVATIKSVYSSSWLMLYNHTTSNPLFCCYNGKDSNTDYLSIYASAAPAYVERVLNPSMDVKLGTELIGDTLDWGEVVYDDSWGTEAAPYSEMKTITIAATDLSEPISVALQTASAFTTLTSSVPAAGGSFSVNFEVNNPGTYTDVLTITCGSLSKTIVLRAKAVREATIDPATLPHVMLSTETINIAFCIQTSTSDIASMHFSASNLAKPLYVKWNKNNQEPTSGMGKIEVLVGEQSINAGESAQFAAPTVDDTEIYISADGYTDYSYSSTLQFYSYKADSKTELAVDESVTFTITVSSTSTGIDDVEIRIGDKIIRNGQILILRGNELFDTTGRRVE